MTREIHVVEVEGVVLAAIVDGRGITDLSVEPADPCCRLGDVFLARVERVDRSVGVVFLDVGLSRPAVLPLRKGVPTEGALIVQIAALPREGKGADATRDVALAGRLLVHRPAGRGIAVSRGLSKSAAGMVETLPPGGWILRRASAGRSARAVAAEAAALRARWLALEAAAKTAEAPTRLESGPDVVQRLVLDTPEMSGIRVDDAARRRSLERWLDAAAPELTARVWGGPIDLAEEVAPLLEPVVPLARGGSLCIEHTRALTAIDVDSGRAPDVLGTNRAAALEVARQLRLRNIGGIVVVDFISMERRADREALVETLREAVADDPAAVTIGRGVSPLGLVELARQRRGWSLAEAFAEG